MFEQKSHQSHLFRFGDYTEVGRRFEASAMSKGVPIIIFWRRVHWKLAFARNYSVCNYVTVICNNWRLSCDHGLGYGDDY